MLRDDCAFEAMNVASRQKHILASGVSKAENHD